MILFPERFSFNLQCAMTRQPNKVKKERSLLATHRSVFVFLQVDCFLRWTQTFVLVSAWRLVHSIQILFAFIWHYWFIQWISKKIHYENFPLCTAQPDFREICMCLQLMVAMVNFQLSIVTNLDFFPRACCHATSAKIKTNKQAIKQNQRVSIAKIKSI